MQINLTETYKKLESKFSYIIIGLVLLLIFQYRSNSGELHLTKKMLETEISKEKKYVASLEKVVIKYEKQIKELDKQILKKENAIVDLKEDTQKQLEKAKKYNTKEKVTYLQKRYSANKAQVSSVDNKVIVSDTISQKIITEAIECDAIKTELVLTKDILKVTNNKVVIKDSIIKTKDKQRLSLENTLKDSELLIKDQQIQIKKEHKSKTFWKIGAVATIVGSVLLLK